MFLCYLQENIRRWCSKLIPVGTKQCKTLCYCFCCMGTVWAFNRFESNYICNFKFIFFNLKNIWRAHCAPWWTPFPFENTESSQRSQKYSHVAITALCYSWAWVTEVSNLFFSMQLEKLCFMTALKSCTQWFSVTTTFCNSVILLRG